VKKGPQDRREAQKEGWYMQRLPKSDQTWTDLYFFFENVRPGFPHLLAD